MKKKPTILATTIVALFSAYTAMAGNKYWDNNGVTTGLQSGPSSGWDTGVSNSWSTATTGTALTTWADDDDAFFQTAGANTVALTGTILVRSLTQATNGTTTTINGGTIQIDNSAGIVNSATSALTINSAISLNATNVTINGTGNITMGGAIGEAAAGMSIVKGGTGTLTLNGSNTYTGGTTINAGLLQFGAAATVPTSGLIKIGAAGTLVASGPVGFANVTDWLASGRIDTTSTGSLALTANSAAALDLTGYSGLFLGSTSTGGVTYSGNLTPGANGYLFGGGGGTLTVTPILSGANKLTTGISGTVILSGANTYTGLTTVGSGTTLQVNSNTGLGSTAAGTVVASGGGLAVGGGVTVTGETVTISGAGSTSFGALTTANAAVTGTWDGTVILGSTDARIGARAGATLNVTGPILGSGANQILTISGESATGTVVLSGNSSYTGVTKITRGFLKIGTDNALPVTTVVDVHDNVGTTETSTLDINGFNQTIGGLQRSATNGTGTVTNSAGGAAKNLTLNVASSVNFGFGPTTATITGNLNLIKTGVGTQTLSGKNTYTGSTTVNAGILSVDLNFASTSSGAGATFTDLLPTSSTLNLGGGTLQLKGRANGTATSIAGTSWAINSTTVNLSAAVPGLAVGQVVSFAGSGFPAGPVYIVSITDSTHFVISAATTAANAVGTPATLTAVANSATTSQTLNGLTLNSGASTIDVANGTGTQTGISTTLDLRGAGGTLGIARTIGGTVDFKASTGTFGSDAVVKTHQANDASGIIGGYATVNGADWAANNGSDTIVAYTTYADVNALGSTIADGASANVRINAAGSGGNNTLGGATTTTINTLLQNTGTLSTIDTAGKTLRLGASGGILVVAGKSGLNFGTAVDAGFLTAGGADNANGELIFMNNAATGVAGAITVRSRIVDNGLGVVSLVKTGPGDLVLSSATNSFTGKTFLNGGVTTIAGDGSLGVAPGAAVADQLSLNGGTLKLAATLNLATNRGLTLNANGGTLDTNGFASTYAGSIAGTGALTKAGAGTWTLTGASSYTGLTTITTGILNIQNNQALGSADGGTVVGVSGTLQLQNVTVTGEALSLGTGGTAPQGYLQTITGTNNTWTGSVTATTASFARIQTDDNSTLTLSGPVNVVTGGSQLVFQGNGTATISGQVSGAGGVLRSTTGSGTLRLTGTNSYAGPTTVSAGTVIVSGSIAGSGVTVAGIATLGGSGTINTTVVGAGAGNTGTIAPGDATASIGKLTLASTNTTAALDLSTGGTYLWELGALKDNTTGTAGVDFDQIALTGFGGNLKLSGTSKLTLGFDNGTATPNGADPFWSSNHTWTIVSGATGVTNTGVTNFTTLTNPNFTFGTFSTSADLNGNVTLTYLAVPEPGVWMSLLGGMGMLTGLQRFRRRWS